MVFNSESRIPWELYPLIIRCVDEKPTLLSLLVSSRAVFADAERQLYHSVEFDYKTNDKHILFLKSFHNPNRAHLSSLVHHYRYIADAFPNIDLLAHIKRALVTFTNLQELRFTIPAEDTFPSVLPLECPPFKLQLFHWSCHREVGCSAEVLQFVATQHSLKTLCLYRVGPGVAEVSLENLQNLSDFAGSVVAFLPLLPRTVPIKRLHWRSGFSNRDLSDFPLLTSLRVLSFSAAPRPPLSKIVEWFSMVEVLGLRSINRNELPHLYRLPLQTLVLDRDRNEDPLEFATEIFCNMVFLQHIFIGKSRSNRYSQWDRDKREATARVAAKELEAKWWLPLDLECG